eukprot:1655088-Rhodomonas_salina.2
MQLNSRGRTQVAPYNLLRDSASCTDIGSRKRGRSVPACSDAEKTGGQEEVVRRLWRRGAAAQGSRAGQLPVVLVVLPLYGPVLPLVLIVLLPFIGVLLLLLAVLPFQVELAVQLFMEANLIIGGGGLGSGRPARSTKLRFES